MERTLKALAELDGRVYVYLANDEAGKAFLAQAELEGIQFGDGAAPTSRPYATVMALNKDGTMNYVGTNGMIAFRASADTIGTEKLIRVDYEKYVSGVEDYRYHTEKIKQ